MTSVPQKKQGFGQIFKWDDKKWDVDSWRVLGKWHYVKVANLATIHLRFAKIKWDDKRGMLTVGDFYKNDKFGENSEFGQK